MSNRYTYDNWLFSQAEAYANTPASTGECHNCSNDLFDGDDVTEVYGHTFCSDRCAESWLIENISEVMDNEAIHTTFEGSADR